MQFDRLTLRRTACIALFAMLWQFLLPVAHAFAAQDELPGRTAVCTAAGIKWVEADGEPLPPSRAYVQHCPLCALLDDGHVAIVAAAALFGLPESASDVGRPGASSAPVPFHAPLPPPSRGPPLIP